MKIMRIDFGGIVKRFRVTDAESETIKKFLVLDNDYGWSIYEGLKDSEVTVEFDDTEDLIDF